MKLNIKLGDDGKYHTRVFAKPNEDGRRPSKRIDGLTKKEVQEKAAAWKEEMEKNRDIYSLTLKDASDKYINYLTSKRNPLSPSTIRSYDGISRNHFKHLHDVPIIDITEDMIQDEIYFLEKTHSGKTIENIVNFYVPCIHHFRRGFKPDLDLPEKEEAKINVPDVEYLRNKIPRIQNRRLLLPVLLAAYCGLRRSEIAALNLHEDVDYDVEVSARNPQGISTARKVGLIYVRQAYVRGKDEYVFKGTKSKAGTRTVFMPGWLNDIVKEFRDDESYTPYPPHTISNVFSEWSKKEKIGCSFHGLRHFYASVGESLNIPDLYMMDMMGHSTPHMLRKYKEIMNEKRVEVNETMLMFLEGNSPFAP